MWTGTAPSPPRRSAGRRWDRGRAVVKMKWSKWNRGETVVVQGKSNGRLSHTPPPPRQPVRIEGRTMVKRWSNNGHTMVEQWSNDGQTVHRSATRRSTTPPPALPCASPHPPTPPAPPTPAASLRFSFTPSLHLSLPHPLHPTAYCPTAARCLPISPKRSNGGRKEVQKCSNRGRNMVKPWSVRSEAVENNGPFGRKR